jgi:hypothetical protein
MDERLDSLLDVAPEATRSANVIERAADILIAEVVPEPSSNTSLATASSAPPAILPDQHMDELQEDMEYARTNMKDVIDQAKAAITGALDMAEQGGEPRAYEVVALMVSSIIQANKDLISLHKTRKDTLKTDKEVKQTGEASTTEIRIEKAVFMGRAQDLLRSLKEIEKGNADVA